MRRLNYFPFALAALMLGACSSNEDVVDNGIDKEATGNDGYISVSINLPSTPAVTKASTDGDKGTTFDDGETNEYAVKDAYLLLFSGKDEASATFYSISSINPNWNNYTADDKTHNQITTTGTVTTKVKVPTQTTGLNLYSYVILNNCGLLKSKTVDGTTTYTLCGTTLNSSVTLKTLQSSMYINYAAEGETAKTVKDIVSSNGFLMSNAPLSTTAGGASATAPSNETSPTVLSSVDWTKIYATEALAKGNDPATEVYVERAMAKVTMSDKSNNSTISNGDEENPIYYKVTSWGLDITNKKSYFARSTEDFTTWAQLRTKAATDNDKGIAQEYRFVGYYPVESGKSLYRTYWAKDPNYTGFTYANLNTEFNTIAKGELELKSDFGNDYPEYCFENTFDVANQNQNQTTRVVVGLTLTSTSNGTPANFYTIGGGSTMYVDKKDGATAYSQVVDVVKGAILNDPTVSAWLSSNFKTTVSGKTDIGTDNINVTLSASEDPTVGSVITITSYELVNVEKQSQDGPDASAITNQLSVADLSNKVGAINFYKGGVAYYPIRIKHFGDLQTPWDNGEAEVSAGQGYPDLSEANYLGRYGVLRNNWYDISVEKVLNIGSPVVPEIPSEDTPDDVKDSYIKCKINVLSWAKRTQSATLQ